VIHLDTEIRCLKSFGHLWPNHRQDSNAGSEHCVRLWVPGRVYCTRSQRVWCKTRVWEPRIFWDDLKDSALKVMVNHLCQGSWTKDKQITMSWQICDWKAHGMRSWRLGRDGLTIPFAWGSLFGILKRCNTTWDRQRQLGQFGHFVSLCLPDLQAPFLSCFHRFAKLVRVGSKKRLLRCAARPTGFSQLSSTF
jgi:hypothetical protein